ncbi:hypothetical protein KP79_PYT12849 [Mizuhopecten yessoensis]|uniref:Uncharacterized protein n=1 Tax=Mizuhopecten yessoensis TaxID=6573 RepID=A0A210R689_MIZYE|nr:hypothetical protein KP79_PYT12849 [Mizuhopecten yessoensis]
MKSNRRQNERTDNTLNWARFRWQVIVLIRRRQTRQHGGTVEQYSSLDTLRSIEQSVGDKIF